jgi:hypothetical protein
MKFKLFGTIVEFVGLMFVSVGTFQLNQSAGWIVTGALMVVAIEAMS